MVEVVRVRDNAVVATGTWQHMYFQCMEMGYRVYDADKYDEQSFSDEAMADYYGYWPWTGEAHILVPVDSLTSSEQFFW